MIQTPLILGDSVQILHGRYVGRTGRVSTIDHTQRSVYVYIGEIREETPDGALTESTEADYFPFDQLTFQDRPLAESVLGPEDRAPEPPTHGLLDEVLANPAADHLRLIYADWLEEHDDPHAEYLRVQVKLADALRSRTIPEAILDRERRLREVLSPEWVGRCRRLTTEPRPFDVAALDPELARQARRAVRLHPRAGRVGDLTASKLGGFILWPHDDPWPEITYQPDDNYAFLSDDEEPDAGTRVPLVAVLQLHARDFPHLPFPPGADLFQLFWVPIWGEKFGPEPHVVWRDSRNVRQPRTQLPQYAFAQWGLVPTECRIYPEAVLEYPDSVEHEPSEALQREVISWTQTFNPISRNYDYYWSQCHGSKTAGFPWVNQSDCEWPSRSTDDGRPMELLLSLSGSEINHCHWGWCPLEDRNLCFTGGPRSDELTGGFHQFSRGNYFLFVDPDNPWDVKSYYSYLS